MKKAILLILLILICLVFTFVSEKGYADNIYPPPLQPNRIQIPFIAGAYPLPYLYPEPANTPEPTRMLPTPVPTRSES